MARMNDPVTFSLRLPADLAARLDAMAAEQKRSRSNVIRHLLEQAVLKPKSEPRPKVIR